MSAELKGGLLYKASQKANGGDRGGRKPKDHRATRASNGSTKTLAELGVSADQSSRWQRMADVPEF